jgi:hypothetical protein
MSTRYRIEEWFRRLEQTNGRMTREDVCFIMVQVRHLIETSNSPERYRVATFYADWVVHSALDRSPVCFEVLQDITRLLVENINSTGFDITKEISRIIGFPQLRAELMNLFRDNELRTVLFDYHQNWCDFVTFLLWFLMDKPIGFPENPTGRAKKIRDEILALQRPYNLIVDTLAITRNPKSYDWSLQISGDKKLTMIGQVEIAEAKDAFSNPPNTV